MNEKSLKALLAKHRSGRVSSAQVLAALKDLPFAELPFATLDTHRPLRQGFPEVVLGQWKTAGQCVEIARRLKRTKHAVLVTRLDAAKTAALVDAFPEGKWNATARTFVIPGKTPTRRGTIAVVCAGTSDLPVAEEAAVTAETMGAKVVRVVDVGVAGLHRLLAKRDLLQKADVVVAVAGMEGALASVVGGLVPCPVIAVPTSVGYGLSLKGVTTFLSMLSSCTPNVTVVNVDNGFGAGFSAALIARRR